jgi:excisionase family DNA binding protein
MTNMSKCHPNEDQLLTTIEVAKYLQVSIRTLQKWRDTGILNYSAIGRKFYYQLSDVKKMVLHFKYFKNEK